jgi:hypothetical protein
MLHRAVVNRKVGVGARKLEGNDMQKKELTLSLVPRLHLILCLVLKISTVQLEDVDLSHR